MTEPIANDVSGQGQFHFGLLKKPVGGGSDITKSGFQPSGINEGLIFGGIFEEDTAGGSATLSPAGGNAQNGTANAATGATGATGASGNCSSKAKASKRRNTRRGAGARLQY